MTDSELTRLARVRDEDLRGAAGTPPARALLAAITSEPPGVSEPPGSVRAPGRRPVATPRRLVLAGAAAVAVTGAAVALPGLLADHPGGATSFANSAIDVRREGGWYVARIKDPLADRAKYEEGFRAVGKDVRIELVPVSPRLVGVMIQSGGGGGGRGGSRSETDLLPAGPGWVDCGQHPERCMLVIRISADSSGWLQYKIGRPARPGEALQDPRGPAATFSPGAGGSCPDPNTRCASGN